MTPSVSDLTISLYNYCKKNDFCGWDPYDGLNSKLFSRTFFNKIPVCRLAWIQFFKRCPVNLRPFALIQKGKNPKGIALFASAALNLYKSTNDTSFLDDATNHFSWLQDNYSKGYSGYAWGYNFPWQSRSDLKPSFFPTIVTTSFIAMSFLDGYEVTRNRKYLDIASSAAKFILNDLNIYREGSTTSFSYGPDPTDTGKVYNATALGGHLFARLYKATGDSHYVTSAINALDFVASRQLQDGSWPYGEHRTQKWIDNFHTGYNLLAFKNFTESANDNRYSEVISKGLNFYRMQLFTKDGAPKYYVHSFFPVDIHACAVSIIMLNEFLLPDLTQSVVNWTINKLWNKKGWFNYQINGPFITKIPYMRWSEAWMVFALSKLL